MPPPPPRPPRQPARTIHRALSIFGAIALIAFVASGIAIEHAKALGLDERFAPAALARWLGYRAAPAVAFVAGDHRLVLTGDVLVLDDRALAPRVARLVGARLAAEGIAMLTGDELVVLDAGGGVVDRIALPSAATALGASAGTLVADTAAGRFALNEALGSWQPWTDDGSIDWARPIAIDADAQRRYDALYYARALSWSNALSAVHSGRIFGQHGGLVVDAAALLLLALVLSGAWLSRQRS